MKEDKCKICEGYGFIFDTDKKKPKKWYSYLFFNFDIDLTIEKCPNCNTVVLDDGNIYKLSEIKKGN